jgi:uncharacterized protein YcfJ
MSALGGGLNRCGPGDNLPHRLGSLENGVGRGCKGRPEQGKDWQLSLEIPVKWMVLVVLYAFRAGVLQTGGLNMKRKSIAALAVSLVGGSAFAADFVDTAQVISSKPIIERVTETHQVCDPAPAQQSNSNSIIAPIVGGLAGGLIGHQVGHGSGQTAATIVGATGGAVAGSMIANHSNSQPVQQCRNVESSRDVVNGYDVVYRYNGRDVSVALPYDPGVGNNIKVGVGIILDEHPADSGTRGGDRNRSQTSSGNGGDNYNNTQYRY